jgi:hypothetical protein
MTDYINVRCSNVNLVFFLVITLWWLGGISGRLMVSRRWDLLAFVKNLMTWLNIAVQGLFLFF